MQRDARHEAVVQTLLDREVDERNAREKRQLRYRYLDSGAAPEVSATNAESPIRLYRFRTKAPCRVTPEARVLLDRLKKQFSGSTVTFLQVASGQQAVMLTGGTCTEPRQIGWVEQCVERDPKRCNVRHQGLTVETDGDSMLVLRFRYPPTAVRMSRSEGWVSPAQANEGFELLRDGTDETGWVDFTEIRPALDLRPSVESSSPSLVWVTSPEVETMNALASRDYEAFYVRFKLEVQAGIWDTLSGLLASSPGSQWHGGSYYTVVREPDTTNGRIYQRTVDDSGSAVDIGLDRTYDASAATDILLLYLGGDLLADFADIYFSLQSLDSSASYLLKEEFFALIRRFWASTESLASRYGSELAAVVRMSHRTAPTPVQAPLLKQDWTNLRQSLVDRYGEGGRNATHLVGQGVYRPRNGPVAWPFATFPAGDVNVGLRLVYRQEWRDLGAKRGEAIRTVPRNQVESVSSTVTQGRTGPGADLRTVETTIEHSDTTRNLNEVLAEAAKATVAAMKWPLEVEGGINTGVRRLGARTYMGVASECRESSRDTSTRLSDIMRRMAIRIPAKTSVAASIEPKENIESSPSIDAQDPADQDTATYVYSRLQNQYELLTRPAEIQNVILVAEKLPTPAEIELSWVKLHGWILTKVLLDESFRDALNSITQEGRSSDASVNAADLPGACEEIIRQMDSFSGTATVRADGIDLSGEWKRGHRTPAEEQLERLQRDNELEARRDRLYEHIRANILHYQRAIWQQEDPQQRSMRYRKSGTKMPLEWQFELESGGALSIAELCDRLTATNVDGQFAAYSAGREADLDEVIDPAGPIGYYGNYAIYRMRTEFGSEDLFSMLHFFKSPYLRPNRETGAAEVADPVEIQITEDPTVLAASDEVIEQRRDEMFRYVPELRQELACARKKVNDGTDPSAVDRLERERGALRRHFATYLFRRERMRRITLDTDSVVIDIIRRSQTPEQPEPSDVDTGPGEAPEPFELVLGNAHLLSAYGHRDEEAGWSILRVGGECTTSLIAGVESRAACAQDPAAEGVMPTRHAGLRFAPAIGAGEARTDAEWVVVPESDEGRPPALLAGAAAARTHHPQPEQAILTQRDGEPAPFLITGAALAQAHDSEPEPMVKATGGGELSPTLVAGYGPAKAHDPDAEAGILAASVGKRVRMLLAGAGSTRTHGGVIVADGKGNGTPKLFAGVGAPPAQQPLIVARKDERLRPILVAE